MEVIWTVFCLSQLRERIKGDENIWTNANSGGSFLGGNFPEFDSFIQDQFN